MPWFDVATGGCKDAYKTSNVPDLQVEYSDRTYKLNIGSRNVSTLVLVGLVSKLNATFAGVSVVSSFSISEQVCSYACQLLRGMMYSGNVRQDRATGIFEACGWLEGSDPKDYYRHFFGQSG
jgi:stringent starvation protein B